MPFVTLPGVHGREIIQVPMQNGVLSLDDLTAAFDQGGELLVWCNPHNPTGRVASRQEMVAIAELVADRGGLVFSDEIHAPLVYPDARHVPFASVSDVAAGCTITAMSASKAWNLAGLKCAQLVFSNPSQREPWDAGLRHFAGEPAMPGVLANIAAYTAGEPWLADALNYLDANRRRLMTRLQEAESRTGLIVEPGQATYLAWIDARRLGAMNAQQFLLEHAGVAVNDGALCGDAGRGYIRLNYATPTPVLDEIIDRIIASAESLSPGSAVGRRVDDGAESTG
jgi:cystathionine beta-lyase